MSKIVQTAIRRNALEGLPIHFLPVPAQEIASPAMSFGAREIQRRTHWSPPLCRTVAALAGFADVEG